MALFTPYHSHLPLHIQDDFSKNEVCQLNGSFEDIVKGCSFDEFYSYVKNRVVFLTQDTAISISCDSPSHHEYTIDVIFSSRNYQKRTLCISGVDARATTPTLNFILRLVLVSRHNGSNNDIDSDEGIEVTFKCFATTPRKKLGSLDLLFLKMNKNRINFSFQFLALEKSHCQEIFNHGDNLSSVEFRQCEVEGWKDCNNVDKKTNSTTKINWRPQKLIISCSQHEFRKFVEGRLLSDSTTINDLHLSLHYILGDLDIRYLTSTLSDSSQRLERLCIKFLDLDDKSWTAICKALHNHPSLKTLTLTYTEMYTDSFRRFSPERRRSRTDDILQLLNKNKILQEVNWPRFQQDESLITDIEQCLAENKKAAITE